MGLFNLNLDLQTFKTHLRNFLIELQEFSNEDNSGLFAEEKQEEDERRRREMEEHRSSIPGMVKPSEIGELDDDL